MATMTTREKFLALETELLTELYERHDEVHGILLAPIANKHIFLYGPPGVAKSFLIDRFTARIEGLGEDGLFKWMLTRFTNDAEVFGPFALSKLKEDQYKRVIKGKLPKAHFAFLDETFKAGSSLLNALLKVLNEREFDNDDDDPSIPLITVMGASNEIPTSTELAALADRFHLWYSVQPIRENSNLVKMLQMEIDPNPESMIALEDIYIAQAEAAAIPFPEDLFETVLELKEHLTTENIEITDRRLKQAISVAKAEAWLNGHEQVEVYDLKPLQFMFWRQTSEIDKVRNIVLALTDPLEREVIETLDNYNHAFAEFEKVLISENDPHAKTDASKECLSKWRSAKKEWDAFRVREAQLGRPCRANQTLKQRLDETVSIIVEDGLGLGLDKVQHLIGDKS